MKTGNRPGVRRVRQATEWGQKYAGSVAEDLRRRLAAMDVINQGVLFAATLLLCLFPVLDRGQRAAQAGRWSTR